MPATLRKLDEPRVYGVGKPALDFEAELLENALHRDALASLLKLNEQIFRVQNRPPRCSAQTAAGESHGRLPPQCDARLVAHRAHCAPSATAQNLDTDFRYREQWIELRKYVARFRGYRCLSYRASTLSAHH